MRTELLRRGARAAAVAALAFATAIGGVATADARSRGHHDHAPKPIQVSVGTSGIDAPEEAEAGLVSFRVATDDPNDRFLEALRPHAGVSIDQVLADLGKAFGSPDPSVRATGISAVRDEADALGGALVTPDVPETFTTPITAGTVFLLDVSAFQTGHVVLRTLELCDGSDGDLADFPDSIVIEQETAAGPRFDVHGLTKATDSILVRNSSDEIHEMELQPVPAGTTDDQLQAAFNGTGAPPAFTGPPVGLGATSPGRTALLETHNLPPGTYVLLCFIPDDKTGIPHATLGMHKVVVLT